MMNAGRIRNLRVTAYRIPTEQPESDGTYEWDGTTIVVVETEAGDEHSLGYTYADEATAVLISSKLRDVVLGCDALAINKTWVAMNKAVRNLGRSGICAMAISAIDTSLWDLKAKLLGLSLVDLMSPCRKTMPIYGSGGFTSYTNEELTEQFGAWVDQGISRVKMKIGRDPKNDPGRVKVARAAIGEAELFVDANGAYSRKQALELSHVFAELDVSWFEEPVSSDDLAGLRLLRDEGPPGMEIAAGEYGYDIDFFHEMLKAEAVDVLQADVTRCGGYTGFLQAAVLCEAYHVALSSHCAPALHLPIGCCARPFRHAEYFHDHARIEAMLFDGAPLPKEGALHPDLSRSGNGLVFKRKDAEKFAL